MDKSKSSNSKRYAAIDVGSNAVRLLVKELVWSAGKVAHEEVVAYYRVPLRLGPKCSILVSFPRRQRRTWHGSCKRSSC